MVMPRSRSSCARRQRQCTEMTLANVHTNYHVNVIIIIIAIVILNPRTFVESMLA